MKEDLTPEEKKIIYRAVRYWQMHKAPLDGKDYKTCDSILNRWFDDVKLSNKEDSNG